MNCSYGWRYLANHCKIVCLHTEKMECHFTLIRAESIEARAGVSQNTCVLVKIHTPHFEVVENDTTIFLSVFAIPKD